MPRKNLINKYSCMLVKESANAEYFVEDCTKEAILKYSKDFNGSLNDLECMKLTGLARNTFYKYKRELKENED